MTTHALSGPRVHTPAHARAATPPTSAGNTGADAPRPADGSDGQLVIDTRSRQRSGFLAAGVGGAVLAAAMGGAWLLGRGGGGVAASPDRAPLIIAGVLAGVSALGFVGAARSGPISVPALAAGHETPGTARLAASGLGVDASVVRAADGSFAVVATPDGLAGHSAATPLLARLVGDLEVDSHVTRHGDLLERTGPATGDDDRFAQFTNRGLVTGAVDLDAIRIDPSTGPGAAFTGMRIGADASGRAVTLGSPVGERAGYASPADATAALYEAGIDDAAFVTVGGRTWAWRTNGDLSSMRAQGTALRQLDALRTQSGPRFGAISTPGEAPATAGTGTATPARALTTDELAGRRIGTNAAGRPVRVGERVGDAAGAATAVEAALTGRASNGSAPHAVLRSGDRYHAFTLAGGVPSREVSPLLGPASDVGVQSGQKLYAPSATGPVFRERITPFDPREPIGRPLPLGGSVGAPRVHDASYATTEAGRSALLSPGVVDRVYGGTRAATALVAGRTAGGQRAHLYELGGAATGAAWDDEMGRVLGVVSRRSERWSFAREEGLDDVYRYEYSRRRAVLDEPGRTSTLRDSGEVLESRTYDVAASSERRRERLHREELERQREIQRQQEAERQREADRQREAERAREAERQREAERAREAERQRERDRDSTTNGNPGTGGF